MNCGPRNNLVDLKGVCSSPVILLITESVPLRFGDCFSRYYVKKDADQKEKAL